MKIAFKREADHLGKVKIDNNSSGDETCEEVRFQPYLDSTSDKGNEKKDMTTTAGTPEMSIWLDIQKNKL